MNMRVGWTLAAIAALDLAVAAAPAWSQGGPNSTADGAAAGAQGAPAAADPAALAMAQAQAQAYQAQVYQAQVYQAQAYQAAAYQQMAAQQAAMYGMQPAAYMTAQGPPPGPFPGAVTPDVNGAYGYMPMNASGPDPYAGGAPAYDQSFYGGGQMGGGPMGGGMGAGGYGGGQNCDQCGPWGLPGNEVNGQHLPNGLLGDCLGLIAPYPDGGCAAPRWYDFAIDYMMMKRDNTGRSQPFTSLGPGPNPNIVLDTDSLNFGQFRPGFRFSGAFQLMAANSLEFTYFGQFSFNSSASVTSQAGNLFSVYSNFGNPLIPGVFAEFENANFQQISYTSQFDSFEINWRRRWMSPNCRYQGSWTVGVRHFILDEKFRFESISGAAGYLPAFGPFIPARGQVDTDTTNNLTGIQVGTDAWICILPGLRAGGEFQAGVYGNHMNINTIAGSNLNTNIVHEDLQANEVSFIGQANMLLTYRFNYKWSGRVGYQFLYVDGVALASENFNPQPPAVTPVRVPHTNDNGNVFYHGWNVGLEYMW